MRRYLRNSLAMVLVTFSSASLASAGDHSGPSTTEKWLDLQRTGEVSVQEHKRVEGEMTQRAYRRLLDSFDGGKPAPGSASGDAASPFGQ